MIPKHDQFITAMNEKKKVCVRFYSKPDSGVLDRVCAPMDYGPGREGKDGLNRYWLWDYLGKEGSRTLGLVPQQIVDLQVLGEGFDPAQFQATHHLLASKATHPPALAQGSDPITITSSR